MGHKVGRRGMALKAIHAQQAAQVFLPVQVEMIVVPHGGERHFVLEGNDLEEGAAETGLVMARVLAADDGLQVALVPGALAVPATLPTAAQVVAVRRTRAALPIAMKARHDRATARRNERHAKHQCGHPHITIDRRAERRGLNEGTRGAGCMGGAVALPGHRRDVSGALDKFVIAATPPVAP